MKNKVSEKKRRQERFETMQRGFESLLTKKKTQPFTMICPVCGEPITVQATMRQRHWAYPDCAFSMWTSHDCPTVVKPRTEAMQAMYPQDLWVCVEEEIAR